MTLPDIHEATKGRWRGILMALGVEAHYLTGKQTACPICREGKDRFVYDDKDGAGTYFCRRCGAGDGFRLLMLMRGTDFPATVRDVRSVCGGAKAEVPKKEWTEEHRRAALNQLWQAGRPVANGDRVDLYLRGRNIHMADAPADLRFVPECPVSQLPGVKALPAMIAMVRDAAGKSVTIHRTYLGDGPKGKAAMDAPRRMFPGGLPKTGGVAVRLFPHEGGRLGVAEGIETALAASVLFEVPVWSCINATLMEQFVPPADVRELLIFGDNDESFTGHAAAYRLAHRIYEKVDHVEVHFPPNAGEDFADVLERRRERDAA